MAAVSPRHVETVRAFNRFYTRQVGVLNLLDSPYSLTEMRVLFELAHRPQLTATEIARELGLDAGYLSRILRRFERAGLIVRAPSTADGRQTLLRLTRRGRTAFAPLDDQARRSAAAVLDPLPKTSRRNLLSAMQTIERLLGKPPAGRAPYVLRAHRPGDMGWVVHRQGALYAKEYGYNHEFEALAARIVADFLDHFDPACERCWIAERDGEIVGTVFLVKKSKAVAKLRLLLVEPSARGLGLGRRLVEECLKFARRAGYRKITLWTQSELEAARSLYRQAGFRRVHSERHHSFGKDLVAETWDVDL